MIDSLIAANSQFIVPEANSGPAKVQLLSIRIPANSATDHAVQACFRVKNGTAICRMPPPALEDGLSIVQLRTDSILVGDLAKKIQKNIDIRKFEDSAKNFDPLDGGNAAALLARWSKNNDIGGEALKLFLTALISMRESMRESRQLALELYSSHAALGVKALQLQGDASWRRDILSAVGQIVSGVLQIGVTAGGCFAQKMMKVKPKTTTENPEAPRKKSADEQDLSRTTLAGQPSTIKKTSQLADGILSNGTKKGDMVVRSNYRKAKQRQAESSEATPEASAALDATKRAEASLSEKLTSENSRNLFLQTSSMIGRSVGDIVNGTFNIGAAYCGLDAAYHGADNFYENAEMQKQIFQRDKWSSESDILFRTMEQVLSSINDMQTRQSESLGKLIGRA